MYKTGAEIKKIQQGGNCATCGTSTTSVLKTQLPRVGSIKEMTVEEAKGVLKDIKQNEIDLEYMNEQEAAARERIGNMDANLQDSRLEKLALENLQTEKETLKEGIELQKKFVKENEIQKIADTTLGDLKKGKRKFSKK